MRKEYIGCNCNSLDHTMRFAWFEDEPDTMYVETFIITYDRWYKRVWTAIKYVFGYRSRYGDTDEYLLYKDQVTQLRDVCQAFLSAQEEVKRK